ncbi:hypothetical protein Q5752_000654 [Cryptotrichosporon argae]
MYRSLWARALFAIPLLRAAAAQVFYNNTIPDVSPMMRFWPSRSGLAAETWNETFSGSPWSTWANNTIGAGSSAHTTSRVGATVAVSWEGTAVWWNANSTGTYTLDVDGQSYGQALEATGLNDSWHTATITVDTGTFSVMGATTMYQTGSTGQSIVWVTQQATDASGVASNTWLDTTGCHSCSENTNFGGGNNSTSILYDRVQTDGQYDLISFTMSSGAAFVLLTGSVNYDHGNYSVSLSPTTSAVDTPANQTFDGLSPWATTGKTLYFAVLDPTVAYTITIENLAPSGKYLDIGAMSYGQLTGTPSASTSSSAGASSSATSLAASSSAAAKATTHTAAIVGGVVGGIAAVVILAAGAFFLIRHGRRQDTGQPTRYYDESTPFEIDNDAEPKITPFTSYYDGPQQAYANAAAGSPYSLSQSSPDPSSGYFGPPVVVAPTVPSAAYLATHSASNSASNISLSQMPMPDDRRDSFSSTRPSRLTLATVLPDSPEAAAASAMSSAKPSSVASRSAGPRSTSSPSFRQETDAGRVPAPAPALPQEEVVPPSYDPAWADEGHAAQASDSDGSAATPSPGPRA